MSMYWYLLLHVAKEQQEYEESGVKNGLWWTGIGMGKARDGKALSHIPKHIPV